MSAQIGAETGWFWRWPAMINIGGAGLWVWLQSKILLWEIYYLLLSLPFFSLSRLPRPHLSLENISVLNRFLSSHCCRPDNPTGTFRALTFDTLEFPGTDFNRRNTHVTKQSRQWSLNGMRYVEHQTKTECVSCYLSHSSPMEEPRWLMGADSVTAGHNSRRACLAPTVYSGWRLRCWLWVW